MTEPSKMFERAVCFTHGSPRSMFERQGRSLRWLTHVRIQPLDVNHADRCWLKHQHLFVKKTGISDISVFPRRPSTITQAAPLCAIVRDQMLGHESSLFPCCCCCLVAGDAAW